MTPRKKQATYRDRLASVRESLQSAEIGALWVASPASVTWLTGFRGTFGHLLVTPSCFILVTDSRYHEEAGALCRKCGADLELVNGTTLAKVLAGLVQSADARQLGFEASEVSWENHRQLKRALGRRSAKLVPVYDLLSELRQHKDATELACLKRAGQVTDEVFDQILRVFHRGVTERQVLRKMLDIMQQCGAEGPSFDPIILFGERTSLVHGKPSDNPLQPGQLVLMDFGVVVEGYCSDCTRTFVFGRSDQSQRWASDLVSRAYQAAVRFAKPGVTAAELDAAARQVFIETRTADAFVHSLGHGVGLEIHERPRLSVKDQTVLEKGMVFTIEPGYYKPGWGGVRIEDTFVMKGNRAVPLTHSDRSIKPSRGKPSKS